MKFLENAENVSKLVALVGYLVASQLLFCSLTYLLNTHDFPKISRNSKNAEVLLNVCDS